MSIFWMALITAMLMIARMIYTRYVPISGVPCVEPKKQQNDQTITIDIRDYQEADNDKFADALVIPIAYLKRYYHEIPSRSIYIVASSHLEKNLAIRFLKNKGFHIVGYTLTTCKCKDKVTGLV
ncbi:hypothetical protein MUN88_11645 [Gracilibacillus caseinilyticus]|uniref:Sulfurtransferase n=1 Tax=Gracilibacillus caseinilyticus TaxID=2932256 RepID=A0ABY4ESX2_9BACI|nr:hypothetical protein [Gracilibacillus caseinilyticus]UOQ46754.1 hypothetical protein MUN88_11645 [Gracilibacillus caseinilyticus]